MPRGNRKVPFSCKRKKEQIIAKRQINKSNLFLRRNSSDDSDEKGSGAYEYGKCLSNVKSINKQPSNAKNRNPNQFNLQFQEESITERQQMKKAARLPFQKIQVDDLEVDDNYFRGYDFPKRPKWHQNMSKEELSRNENRYFKEYIDKIMKIHHENPNTSVFELNLETWRQLWRVIEMSDILLILVDARYPSLMFPPDLFDYLENKLKKNVILILNKIDLISSESALAWKNYFTEKYEGIHVIYFASYKRQPEQSGKYYLKHKRLVCWESIQKICEICKEIVHGHNIDLTTWEQKILEDSQIDEDEKLIISNNHIEDTAPISTEYDETCIKFKNGILTIGCIGFPNVGKSSLINSLKGKKVVSVSKTPGHTKHFQTIFLTENVKLCDSPGLVFPSKTPKYLQVLIGSFPIAQLKEPNRSLMYIGERIDLPKILNINLPPDFDEWSAVAVCEAWCLKRGFFTAKASRPDHYRAANNLLRIILEGKIVIQNFPLGFKDKKDELLKNTVELENIRRMQGCERDNGDEHNSSNSSVSEDDITREDTESDSNNHDVMYEKGSCSTSRKRELKQGNFFNLLESD